ncbi:MAG: alpha-hydroxy-acid oxidizing protein [Acidimicrobiia bacterium]
MPLKLRSGAELRNRFVLAPMTTDSSQPDGNVTDSELDYLRRRCTSEFAMTISSCAYVDEGGRAWHGIGAVDRRHLDSLGAVAAALGCGGAVSMLQLYDGGRISDPALAASGVLRAPSAVASSRPNAATPRSMASDEIVALVEAFGRGAELGVAAGFDGIEIHGANHYVIHQFFSPRSNRRGDEWGGDRERRARFALAVTDAVRAAVGDERVVGFRVNPFEPESTGFGLDDSIWLSVELAERGVDYVHISMDNFRKNSPQREDRDWTRRSTVNLDQNPIRAIADAVAGRCAIIASGGITTRADAEDALAHGADLVAVGRAALIDPAWIGKVMAGCEHEILQQLPHEAETIVSERTIPQRMVKYLLSRPGWIAREGAP